MSTDDNLDKDLYQEILNLLHEAFEMGVEWGDREPIAFAGDPLQMHFDNKIREITKAFEDRYNND